MENIILRFTRNCKVIGIGTGRTMKRFVNYLTNNFVFVPSSQQASLLLVNRITKPLQNIHVVDVYFDSADYYDSENNLIKGGGGCLTKEKLLLSMAKSAVIIVDKAKFKKSFSDLYVPIEIIPDSYSFFMNTLKTHNLHGKLRLVNELCPFNTENHNYIVDVQFDIDFIKICKNVAGVVEHGYVQAAQNYVIELI